jgi:hypothetical protein
MSNHRTIRQRALVAVGLLSVLTACSDGDGPRASTEKPGEPTASATHVGARAALTGFQCTPDSAGTWSATGTLNNADAAKATYVVRISVSGKDSHVVASATKNVTVEATSNAELVVADFGKATGKGLDCSAHVTRAVS